MDSRGLAATMAYNLVRSVRANIRVVEPFRPERILEVAESSMVHVVELRDVINRSRSMQPDTTAEQLLDVLLDDAEAEIVRMDVEQEITPDAAGAAKAVLAKA